MKNFKIIVAGCGSMSKVWMDYAVARTDTQIAALVDINPDNAKRMADNYKLDCGIFTQLDEAIEATGANLVFNITIPDAHKDIVLTALSRGCDVLGEKPMSSTMEEAEEMISAAEKYNRSYSVMQNRRYLKNIRAFRQLIASGAIGKPGFVCADFFLGPHFGGFRDLMDSPLLLDMAIHTFDQARFITGADPVSVYCHEFNPYGSWYKGDACSICIFEMSDGSVFCYRGSWCAEGCNTSWESAWRITGSKGTAIWDGHDMPYAEVVDASQENKFINKTLRIDVQPEWKGQEGHFGCLDEMFDALLQGRKAETDCRDNIKSMAMVFGALESSRSNKKVML